MFRTFIKEANDTFGTDFVSLAYQKDLVFSQEMHPTPLMSMVFGPFPHYFYASATSFFFGKVLTRTGVVTSSPVLPSSIDYVRTETLEPVVNIHGINFVDGLSYRKEMNRI